MAEQEHLEFLRKATVEGEVHEVYWVCLTCGAKADFTSEAAADAYADAHFESEHGS